MIIESLLFHFRYPDGVHMQDLESALHFTFRMEVPRVSTIGGEKLMALKQLLTVLAKVIFWDDIFYFLYT